VYFGAVREEVDTGVLRALAAAGVHVSVIGTVERPAMAAELAQAGVELRPAMPVQDLATEVLRFELLLLPYRGARAATIVPAKLWNCLATGRWVLATGLQPPVAAPNLVVVPPDGAVAAALDLLERGAPAAEGPPPRWPDRWQELLRHAGL
jgi:hypothetical protein